MGTRTSMSARAKLHSSDVDINIAGYFHALHITAVKNPACGPCQPVPFTKEYATNAEKPPFDPILQAGLGCLLLPLTSRSRVLHLDLAEAGGAIVIRKRLSYTYM